MTSPYTPRPALTINSRYLAFHSVQKRFPAFLRCHASYFLSESEFAHVEVATSPVEFRNAVAKLPPNPILGPLSGGTPLIMYLAGRGLEEDFRELSAEIQEGALDRLAEIPSSTESILILFGAPPIDTTAWTAAPAAQQAPPPEPPASQPEPEPPLSQPEPEPAPTPALQVEPAPEPQPDPAPAVEPARVEIETPPPAPTSTGVQLNAPTARPEPEPTPSPAAPAPEPVPEPLPVDTTAAVPGSPLPASSGSAAIDSEALARELTRHFARQQDAVGAAMQNALQAARDEWQARQLDALRKLEAELAARQSNAAQAQQEEHNRQLQAALARMRNELSIQQEDSLSESRTRLLAELRSLLIGMYDDHA